MSETAAATPETLKAKADEMAVLVADNRLAELSETDEDAPKKLLRELDGKIGLDLTGFDEDSLDDILDRLDTQEDESNTVPAPPVDPITRPPPADLAACPGGTLAEDGRLDAACKSALAKGRAGL